MKVRIISAIIALAIIIPFIYLGGIPFAALMGIFAILAFKEVLNLKKSHGKIPKIASLLSLVALLYLILGDYGMNSLYMSINNRRLILPLFLIILPTVFYRKDHYNTKDAFFLTGIVYLLGLLFNSFIVIRNVSLYIFIYLICITILTDTFAYAIGCLIGRNKMCPNISPNKSWEGAIAGFVGGVSISLIVYANLVGSIDYKVIIMTILLSIIGQVGDLVFSKMKRDNNIKDFSNIMPGHGGILDRLDSLTFVILGYILIRIIL